MAGRTEIKAGISADRYSEEELVYTMNSMYDRYKLYRELSARLQDDFEIEREEEKLSRLNNEMQVIAEYFEEVETLVEHHILALRASSGDRNSIPEPPP